jgi:hypothetical protein
MTLDYGFLMSLTASLIALWGVYLFNQKRDYTGARMVWMFSNTLFVIFFFGRISQWYEGGLSDVMMYLYFSLMWISNAWGMK